MNKRLHRHLMLATSLSTPNIPDVPLTTGGVGDICFYDSNDEKIIFVPFTDYSNGLYPASRYNPLGVVVIPSSHNVYGNGCAGVMSLNWINTNNYANGGALQNLSWDKNYIDFRYDGVPLLPNLTSNAFESYEYDIGVGYAPHQGGSVIPSGKDMDKQSGYYDYATGDSRTKYIPSPYLNDGSKNPVYHQVTFNANGTTYTNVLADFAGKQHQAEVLSSSNKPNVFVNSSKYCPTGTNAGDWYFPTIGELGYLAARIEVINNTITRLAADYGVGYAITECRIWSANGYTGNSSSKYVAVFVSSSDNMGQITYTYYNNRTWGTRVFLQV